MVITAIEQVTYVHESPLSPPKAFLEPYRIATGKSGPGPAPLQTPAKGITHFFAERYINIAVLGCALTMDEHFVYARRENGPDKGIPHPWQAFRQTEPML
jgi:hypothetical protein